MNRGKQKTNMPTTAEIDAPQRFYLNKISDTYTELPPTTFARIRKYQEMDVFHDWDEPGVTKYDVYEVWDNQTDEIMTLDTVEELDDFILLDVGVREYGRYKSTLQSVEDAVRGMPMSRVSEGVLQAAKSALRDKLALVRRIRTGEEQSVTLEEVYTSFRDLNFAFSSIATALSLGSDSLPSDHLAHAWFKTGKAPSNKTGAYNAQYDVCNDTYVDEGDQDKSESGRYYDSGAEIHYPAELEIRVDSEKRIEFNYTPKLSSARAHHHSQSLVHHEDGRTRQYDNWSLSIRIDLDPDAPAGIALDIARSDHKERTYKDGKKIDRQGDLVGKVMAAASPHGSHQYEGFTPDMAADFKNFAEHFAVQLDLQRKELKKRSIGRSAIENVF